MSIITMMLFFYKWRYRILNILLSISFIRKIATASFMKMPKAREGLLKQ